VSAKVNNGLSCSTSSAVFSRCMSKANSYNVRDRTNSFLIFFLSLFLLVVVVLLDDEDAAMNAIACKCKVNAKLYMTIIRNFENKTGE